MWSSLVAFLKCWFVDDVQIGDAALVYVVFDQQVDIAVEGFIGSGRVDHCLNRHELSYGSRRPIVLSAKIVDSEYL